MSTPAVLLAHRSSALITELNCGWELLPDFSATRTYTEVSEHPNWRPARPAICWNAQYEDLRGYMGLMWYRTRFQLTDLSPHLLLHFGAVDYYCEAFVNGIRVGSHEGGYTPFSFDIAALADVGENELVLRVIDPPLDEAANLALCPEMMYNEIPHGKQSWYMQNGGVWQPVWLERQPAVYVDRLLITPHVSGRFSADIQLHGAALATCDRAQLRVTLQIRDAAGAIVTALEGASVPQCGILSLAGSVAGPQLWEPDSPHLYTAEVMLHGFSGDTSATKRVHFGFRSFEAQGGKLFLNGKPFYLRGALDQDFYSGTIHSTTEYELVRDLMWKAKRLGINVLRCHLKVADPIYLQVADEIGMLVWAEMPSWSDCWYAADHFSDKAAERSSRMSDEVLLRDWNHPSIVIQTIMNESWGIDLKQPSQRQWLKNRFRSVRAELAPLGRLVIDNSACEKNFHLATDIEDFHNYYSMPDDVEKWEKWTRELAQRPEWTFSPHGDAERTGNEPLLVSEFGNWGLPRLSGDLPWWFDCDFGGRSVTRPTGVLDRFHLFGFGRLYSDFGALAEDTQRHQFLSMKHEIEDIRQHPSIQGYVVTGMTDVHWEANGLLDMDRNSKIYAPELALLQRSDLVMLRSARRNFYAGSEIAIDVLFSHYSDRPLENCTVRWSAACGLQGHFSYSQLIAPGTVERIGEIVFAAPHVDRNQRIQIYAELSAPDGDILSVNNLDIFVYAGAQAAPAMLLHDPDGTAKSTAEALVRAGVHLCEPADLAAIGALMLATRLDGPAEEHLSRGGALVVLCHAEDALPPGHALNVRSRAGTELDGRWFSNYNWIQASAEPFHNLDFGTLTGFEAAKVTPRFVIQGLDPTEFASLYAGITYGWLAENSALALPIRVAGATAIATTFSFDCYGDDPYATHLLNNLLAAAQSLRTKDGVAATANIN